MTATTDMPSTAQVETMTATVEVLKMGGRQVTAGVYRQLDEVFLDEMEPFGRVNLPIKGMTSVCMGSDPEDGDFLLIGRSRKTGALVRAFYSLDEPIWGGDRSTRESNAFVQWVSLHYADEWEQWKQDSRNVPTMTREYRRLNRRFKRVVGTTAAGPVEWNVHFSEFVFPEDCDLGVLEAQWRQDAAKAIGEFNKKWTEHELCRSLPLIVLAGR